LPLRLAVSSASSAACTSASVCASMIATGSAKRSLRPVRGSSRMTQGALRLLDVSPLMRRTYHP